MKVLIALLLAVFTLSGYAQSTEFMKETAEALHQDFVENQGFKRNKYKKYTTPEIKDPTFTYTFKPGKEYLIYSLVANCDDCTPAIYIVIDGKEKQVDIRSSSGGEEGVAGAGAFFDMGNRKLSKATIQLRFEGMNLMNEYDAIFMIHSRDSKGEANLLFD